jgi:uncharacterized protein (TIGR02594 family)
METREMMWMELMKYYGLTEIVGKVHNKTILSWFKELGYPEIQEDEVSWCSLAINIIAKRLGIEYTGKLDARSWMKIGKPVDEPRIGHVAVFYRYGINAWQGHVGLFGGYTDDKKQVLVLGGNQGNQICIRPYPILTPTLGLLGYRELKQLR